MNRPIPQIKFCGLKEQIHIDFCAENDVDFVGFVFHEQSIRNLALDDFANLNLKNTRNVVAVFQNPTAASITNVLQENRVDFIQIHGEIPQEFIDDGRVIKAFSGENFTQEDFEKYDFCKYFLFDGARSGSGERQSYFKQTIPTFTLQDFTHKFPRWKPFFLAGGINVFNAHEPLSFTNMIDVSSGIEEIRGVKSLQLMEDFLMCVRPK